MENIHAGGVKGGCTSNYIILHTIKIFAIRLHVTVMCHLNSISLLSTAEPV